MSDRSKSFVVPVLLLGAVVLSSCARRAESPAGDAETAGTTSLGVVEASSYPLSYMAQRVGGPLVEVGFRAAVATDPAYWRPTAEDVLALQSADLVILNGASYESWASTVSLPSSRTVDTSAGFRDRLISIEGGVTHSHGLEGEHTHTGTAFTTWLDPTLAVEQAQAIRDAMIARWPEQRSLFEDGYAELERDLLELDDAFAAAVGEGGGTPVVFSHPVYQYLERRYGLNGKSVHWEADEEPGQAAWTDLGALLADHPAHVMIWEGEPLAETAKRLEGMGVESVVVEPCGNRPVDGDFLDAMKNNVSALERVYGGRAQSS